MNNVCLEKRCKDLRFEYEMDTQSPAMTFPLWLVDKIVRQEIEINSELLSLRKALTTDAKQFASELTDLKGEIAFWKEQSLEAKELMEQFIYGSYPFIKAQEYINEVEKKIIGE